MNRKERRAALRETYQAAAAALQPAWKEDATTDQRMAAIQESMRIINNSELPITYTGLAQLYLDYVCIAEQDPEFPVDMLSVLQTLLDKVETVIAAHRKRVDRIERLVADVVDTYCIWDKMARR